VVGDIAEITSLPEASFDVVTCISVLEHVGVGGYDGKEHSEAVAFLRALRRFVKPGGHIVMTFPFGKDCFSRLNRVDSYRVISEQYLLLVLNAANLSDVRQTYFKLTDRYWYPCNLGEASSVDSSAQVQAIGGIILHVH
jgi:ubiquinone/menaquinone biosynthesis C-methylase UbiE